DAAEYAAAVAWTARLDRASRRWTMAKDWEDRLAETVKTIATAKVTKNANRQKDVSVAIEAWLEEQAKQAETWSGWLSLEDADVTGPKKSIRDLRRALMLVNLWRGFKAAGVAVTQKAMGDAPTLADNKLLDALGVGIGDAYADLTA